MKRKNKNKGSGFSGFLGYFRNKMSGEERNAFEKELQKDPFAEEAAEGFRLADPEKVTDDIRLLRRRLSLRTGKSTYVTLSRIAASIAILLVISSVFILLEKKPAPESVVPGKPQQPLEIAKAERYLQANEPEVRKEKRSVIKETPPAAVRSSADEKNAAGNINISEIPEVHDIDSFPVPAEAAEQEKAETIMHKGVDIAADRAAPSMRKAVFNAMTVIRGKVISAEDSMPVPGAAVNIQGTHNTVLTDENGYFAIPVREEEPVTLIASFIGMTTQRVEAAPGSEKEITLQPDVGALSEVVVVGYGVSKEAEYEDEVDYTAAEPIGGRKAFDNYIEKNIVRPDSATAGQRVVVVAGFKIGNDGKPDSIRIIRSPGISFSDEAIRLLKEGPEWKPPLRNGSPVNEEIRIRIVFR